MTFVKNADSTFTVTLAAPEQAELATLAKVRGKTEAEVLNEAAQQVQRQLAEATADVRTQVTRTLYKRIDAAPIADLLGLLETFTVPA